MIRMPQRTVPREERPPPPPVAVRERAGARRARRRGERPLQRGAAPRPVARCPPAGTPLLVGAARPAVPRVRAAPISRPLTIPIGPMRLVRNGRTRPLNVTRTGSSRPTTARKAVVVVNRPVAGGPVAAETAGAPIPGAATTIVAVAPVMARAIHGVASTVTRKDGRVGTGIAASRAVAGLPTQGGIRSEAAMPQAPTWWETTKPALVTTGPPRLATPLLLGLIATRCLLVSLRSTGATLSVGHVITLSLLGRRKTVEMARELLLWLERQ